MMGKRRRAGAVALTALSILLIGLSFGAGMYLRDLSESGSAERLVKEYFTEIKAGRRGNALAYWDIPDNWRKSLGDLDVKSTDALLAEGPNMRSLKILTINYFRDGGTMRPASERTANRAEVNGFYETGVGKTDFRMILRDLNSDIPLVNRLGHRWRLLLAETGETK